MINKINAIVTGGSSGLGEATARKILEKGGNVSILDMQEDVAKALSEEQMTCTLPASCDLTELLSPPQSA